MTSARELLGIAATSAGLWSKNAVYNGYHANLLSRAREHVFGHKGTGAMALDNYDALHTADWTFWYLTMEGLPELTASKEMILRFGELLWRMENGWPVLCME